MSQYVACVDRISTGSRPPRRMVGAQPIAEMVGRQLSDREPDSVFRESLAVAQVFAKSVAH